MRSFVVASASLALASSLVWIACSNSSGGGGKASSSSGSSSGSAEDSGGLFALGVPCTDSDDAVYGDPGALPADNGAIIKCATDPDLTQADLTNRLASANDMSTDPPPATNLNYSGTPLTSGAHVYRILYRTERGDAPGGDAAVGSPGWPALAPRPRRATRAGS
jgi:hypothetical protein